MSHNFAAIEPKTLKCDKNFLKKLKKQKIARRPFINNCGVFFYEKGGRGGGGRVRSSLRKLLYSLKTVNLRWIKVV